MAGKFIAERYKDKTIAVLHDKQQYGEGIATEVKKTVEDAGIKVAVFEGLNAGDKDFNALISKLKKAGVQFVYFGGYHPEMGLLLRQAKQAGLDARFMGPEGSATAKSPRSPATPRKACWQPCRAPSSRIRRTRP